jgi:hypothetical protein
LYKKRPDGLWPKIQPVRARAFCLFSKSQSPSQIFGLGLEPDPALVQTYGCPVKKRADIIIFTRWADQCGEFRDQDHQASTI